MPDSPIPSFAELAADPEIAPLLTFTPVTRQINRPNGWTPELQRELIARIAATGTLQQAVWQMGKHSTGAEGLYKKADAVSFRASWDAAIIIGRRRNGLDSAPPFAGAVPGITRRAGRGRQPEPEPAPEEVSEERKWELIHSIGLKFMRKVAAEREARRNGEIVAADFYLRQITFLEVMLEMTSKAFGWDVQAVLTNLRRGDHHITAIVNTELSDWMDRSRRAWWAQEGEPERPAFPDVRFLKPRRDQDGAYGTAIDQGHLGACAHPARGYDEAEWAALTANEQAAAWKAQYTEDAAAQAEWERRAFAEHSEKA